LNKRISKRVPFRIPVKFGQQNECTLTGLGIDISKTGFCIKTNSVYPPGTLINILVHYNNEIFHATGTVVWAKKVPPSLIYTVKAGMGIRFKNIDIGFKNMIIEKTEK